LQQFFTATFAALTGGMSIHKYHRTAPVYMRVGEEVAEDQMHSGRRVRLVQN